MAKTKVKTGRKRIPDEKKTVLVGFYTKKEVVNLFGGMERIREVAKHHVEERAKDFIETITVA